MNKYTEECENILNGNVTHKTRWISLMNEYSENLEPIVHYMNQVATALQMSDRIEEAKVVEQQGNKFLDYMENLIEAGTLIQQDFESFLQGNNEFLKDLMKKIDAGEGDGKDR